jgi:uncharacterized lipoprotein YmbA
LKINLIVLAALLLGGCGSQTVDTPKYYLLRSDVDIDSGKERLSGIVLGRVEVATYIDQPGLVLDKGGTQIHVARHHKWAEPLRLSLRRFLALEISSLLNTPVAVSGDKENATTVNVTVDQLHGNSRGEAVLVAYWEIVTAEGESNKFRFSDTGGLEQDGYEALVAAEHSLLQRLSQEIAKSLKTSTH